MSLRTCALVAVSCAAGIVAGCGAPTPTNPAVTSAAPTQTPTQSNGSAALVDQLETIALQAADLAPYGTTFDAFDVGPTQLLDALPAPQSAADRFGRIAGWKARYRQGPDVITGILVVDSRVDLFPDDNSAAADLAAYDGRFAAQATRAGQTGVTKSAPAIGNGATMVAVIPADQAQVRTATIAFRVGRFTGQILVSGLGNVDPAQAAQTLGAAVAKRMSDALAGR